MFDARRVDYRLHDTFVQASYNSYNQSGESQGYKNGDNHHYDVKLAIMIMTILSYVFQL